MTAPAPRLKGSRRPTPPGPLTPERVDAALVTLATIVKAHPGLLPLEGVRAAATRLLAEKNRLAAAVDVDALLNSLAP